jgi:Zn-finger nucleic acid-binding protein
MDPYSYNSYGNRYIPYLQTQRTPIVFDGYQFDLGNRYNFSTDYLTGIIYSVYFPTYPNLIYIGSTKLSIVEQRNLHITNYNAYKSDNQSQSQETDDMEDYITGSKKFITLYNIFDKYGYDNCVYQIIQYYPCLHINELQNIEAYHINITNCVNKKKFKPYYSFNGVGVNHYKFNNQREFNLNLYFDHINNTFSESPTIISMNNNIQKLLTILKRVYITLNTNQEYILTNLPLWSKLMNTSTFHTMEYYVSLFESQNTFFTNLKKLLIRSIGSMNNIRTPLTICKVCCTDCITPQKLITHLKKKIPCNSTELDRNTLVNEVQQSIINICPKCNKEFPKKNGFQIHVDSCQEPILNINDEFATFYLSIYQNNGTLINYTKQFQYFSNLIKQNNDPKIFPIIYSIRDKTEQLFKDIYNTPLFPTSIIKGLQ